MSKGLINSRIVKNFSGAKPEEILDCLVESGLVSKENIEQYINDFKNKKEIELEQEQININEHSIISDGVLVKFDQRDLNRNGGYVVPRRVHTIGYRAFARCGGLKRIHLGRDVIKIQSEAFYDCVNLKQVTMTNSVVLMNQSVFYGCLNLEDLKLSDKLRGIPRLAFVNCKSLQEVILPKNIKYIDEYAFANCENISSISNPPTKLDFVHPKAFLGAEIGDDFIRKFEENRESAEQSTEVAK